MIAPLFNVFMSVVRRVENWPEYTLVVVAVMDSPVLNLALFESNCNTLLYIAFEI